MAHISLGEKQHKIEQFVAFWADKGYEKGHSQQFWMSLLQDVLGVEDPKTFITFEEQVKMDHTAFIDGYIPTTHVLIEQKGRHKKLNEGIRQSDGSLLTPFQQAQRYAAGLPYSQRPRWIITCNFVELWVYDMEQPNGEPQKIAVADLAKEAYRLQFIVDAGNSNLRKEQEISVQAGRLIGAIYDKLLLQYKDPNSVASLASLNQLCVRIVFCLFAEDAGLFGNKNEFHDYIKRFPASYLRKALIDLFVVLDTPIEDRDPYLEDELKVFPYVNGGLFKESIEIPQLTEEIKTLLLGKASEDFDWSEISPTIFGAVFESTLNQATRREGGMHYTSIENIHKVIDPLFLNDLHEEIEPVLTAVKGRLPNKQEQKQLHDFQDKLASLRFFDPACGSGNFLTETYLSLRRLENKIIRTLYGGQAIIGEAVNPIKVSIHQFYGIEINDFAVSVAKTALWIAEEQMLRETEKIVSFAGNPLPLKTYDNIHEGNALRFDWESVLSNANTPFRGMGGLYIIGNPPFVGARMMDQAQKDDMLHVFGRDWKNIGNLDYVSGWYKKAVNLMQGTSIKAALVSTNSVCQGESVANLWKPLFEAGVHIDFAHRTFRWDSESNQKAHVHCVIVGFSCRDAIYRVSSPTSRDERTASSQCTIYDNGTIQRVPHINAYLLNAEDIFVESHNKPICSVPEIGIGNKPIDDGNYLFSKEEMEEFIAKEPASAKYFKPWYGAFEFINNKPRYCLWLGDCPPQELRQMPHCRQRIENVRNFRLASKSAGTVKLADRPTRFHVENMPEGNYIVIPETSSENRRYTPMGFMDSTVLCSNALRLAPNATLYHFGILTSNVHMAWMRAVCGRLKSDYRYSKDIVYNNFPWCEPTAEQKQRIEATAQGILDARALYPEASLADLYDELTMPVELRKAHQANDRAVMAAYGFALSMTEQECVAELMKRYQQLTVK